MPGAVGVKGPEVALPPLSELVEVKTGDPLQAVSPGAKTEKATDPVGLTPPIIAAVSVMVVPTGPPAEELVTIPSLAALEPKCTPVAPVKSVPVMLTLVPPLAGPLAGVIAVTAGGCDT